MQIFFKKYIILFVLALTLRAGYLVFVPQKYTVTGWSTTWHKGTGMP